jgi:hypothetical protein
MVVVAAVVTAMSILSAITPAGGAGPVVLWASGGELIFSV